MDENKTPLAAIHDLISNGRNKIAEEMLKKVLLDTPNDRGARFELGRLILFGKKKLAEAEIIFRELLTDEPKSTTILVHLYLCLRDLRKLPEAQALIEKLKERAGDALHPMILAFYADFMTWAYPPDYRKYMPIVENAFQLDSNNPLIARIKAVFLIAQVHLNGQQSAIEFIQNWIQAHPGDQNMLYSYAVLLRTQRKLNEAGKLLEQVIVQNPDNPEYVALYEENKKVLDYWTQNAHLYPPYVKSTVIAD